MFSIRDTDGPLRTLELRDDAAKSTAQIAPTRGGMVAQFEVDGRPLLFLDPVSFLDPSTNVRGGIPVLFPSPGKLAGDAWSRGGKSGMLRQHGFARTLPWDVTARSTDGAARATLRQVSSAATLAAWPWRFAIEIRYSLVATSLRLDVRVANEDASPMPFGFGLHPYFAVLDAEKSNVSIPTQATRAFDNVTKREVDFQGFDFTKPEVDLHLVDHGASHARIQLPNGSIELRGSPEFTRWVVWSLEGRDFVCLEPWTCPGNALNTGEGLIEIAPGGEKELCLEIAFAAN